MFYSPSPNQIKNRKDIYGGFVVFFAYMNYFPKKKNIIYFKYSKKATHLTHNFFLFFIGRGGMVGKTRDLGKERWGVKHTILFEMVILTKILENLIF